MKTILVDDELWTMEQFKEECAGMPEIELVGEFVFAQEALDYARNHPVEFALLDIELNGMDSRQGMNGVELAKELRKLYPKIIIVFVTSHTRYLKDFIDIKADYFVVKPYNKADVEDALERAKAYAGRLKKRIRVQTFGTFEVYLDGKPLAFKSAKAKELLALLVQKRGGIVTPTEGMNLLYDGRVYNRRNSSTFRMTVYRLQDTLEEAGIDNLIRVPDRGYGRYIDPALIDCDLYDYLDGKEEGRKRFSGVYLSGYSWGEEMLSELVWRMNGR